LADFNLPTSDSDFVTVAVLLRSGTQAVMREPATAAPAINHGQLHDTLETTYQYWKLH